jgi:long-chain acyl-CoA synthetase
MRLLSDIRWGLARRPRHVFVRDDQRAWRGIDLLVGSWHLARAIERSGSTGAVAAMLPTSGLFPMAMLAAWQLGRPLVPLNYLLSRSDLAFVAKDAGCDVLVTVQPMLDFTEGAPSAARTLRLEDISFRGLPRPRWGNPLDDREVAVLLYTSGTSGRPKGVELTGANLAANIRQIRGWVDFGPQDRLLGVLPQFHSFGLTVLTILPLVIGGTAIYMAKFMPRRLVELARKERPTALIAIPSMYNALLGVKDGGPEDFASLRYVVSGGEPLPAAVAEAFHAKFGKRINEGYGLTETSPVTNWCRPEEYRPGSVGRPLPEIDQRIVGPDGRVLGPGEEGEIRMKGPNIMRGYRGLESETRAVFDEEGYFRTGDMGRFDEEGFLSITGRIKEMLIIAGENVFPREIEEILNRHPSVRASAVIGMPDGNRGEVPLAFVELEEGASFDEQALRAYCRERIAQYKVPREIRRLEALPRNATGKILRRQLTAQTPAL